MFIIIIKYRVEAQPVYPYYMDFLTVKCLLISYSHPIQDQTAHIRRTQKVITENLVYDVIMLKVSTASLSHKHS